MDGALAIFFGKSFHLPSTVQLMHDKNQACTWTKLSPIFRYTFLAARYCESVRVRTTLPCMDGTLAIFFVKSFHLPSTVQPVRNKNQAFTWTELSPIFRYTFLPRSVLCGRFASKNVNCMDETLAFFPLPCLKQTFFQQRF